jgi:hypothetical protein
MKRAYARVKKLVTIQICYELVYISDTMPEHFLDNNALIMGCWIVLLLMHKKILYHSILYLNDLQVLSS